MERPLPVGLAETILDPSGAVIADLACRRCGYNLRGLNQAGLCPECATPVGLSTQGDLLRFSDPLWVGTLARGVRFILWGMAAATLAGTVGSVLFIFINPAFGVLVMFLGAAVGYYGTWLLTEPDPSGIGEDRTVTARKTIRVTLLAGAFYNVLYQSVERWNLPPGVMIVLLALSLSAGLCAVVGEIAKLMYLEKLTARIPDPKLAGRARTIRWGYALCYPLLIVSAGVVSYVALMSAPGGGVKTILTTRRAAIFGMTGTAPAGPFGAANMVGGCLAGLSGVALLVFIIMALGLLVRVGKAFRAQAREARTIWSSKTG